MFCLQGDIVLNKVSFAYPGREDSDVLRGVDLTLARGQVTALVGSSGAGKSTVTQLLCRFYDPGSGSVTVGGEFICIYEFLNSYVRAIGLTSCFV